VTDSPPIAADHGSGAAADDPSRSAAAWLRARIPAAPPALLAAMLHALDGHDGASTVADALAEAAVRLYARVRDGGGGREDALPLLAADALLTHALQAQAESDPAALADFAQRWGGAGVLGRLADEPGG
jgi:hypothetical protein